MAARWMACLTAVLPRGCAGVLRAVLLTSVSIAGCGQGGEVTSSGTHGVAVYVLSRGKGVPDATRAARDKARALLQQLHEEKRVLAVEETPIGLEGERRICATFASSQDAAAAAERLRAIGANVELFNVVIEPCAKAGVPMPQQEVKP
jgi:hypothetical protein